VASGSHPPAPPEPGVNLSAHSVLMSSAAFDTSAVVRSRSSSWVHTLTRSRRPGAPFPYRFPPRLLTDAVCGGFKPSPAQLTHIQQNPIYIGFSSPCSRHTILNGWVVTVTVLATITGVTAWPTARP